MLDYREVLEPGTVATLDRITAGMAPAFVPTFHEIMQRLVSSPSPEAQAAYKALADEHEKLKADYDTLQADSKAIEANYEQLQAAHKEVLKELGELQAAKAEADET